MGQLCNASQCSEFSACTSVIECLGIDFHILDKVMLALRQSHNFDYVREASGYDFDFNGTNLRSCYSDLIAINTRCAIRQASGVDGTR